MTLLPITINLLLLLLASVTVTVTVSGVPSSDSDFSSSVADLSDHGAPIIQIEHLPPGHPFRLPTHRQPDEQTIVIEYQQPVVNIPPKVQVPVVEVIPSVPIIPIVTPTPTVVPTLPPRHPEPEVEVEVTPVKPVVPPAAVPVTVTVPSVAPSLTPTPASSSPSASLCPAITWTHKYECSESEGKCLLSFINTSPNLPVDWVDIHLVSNSIEAIKLVGSASASASDSSIPSSSASVHLNYRMHLMAGSKGLMHAMHLNEGSDQVDPISLPLLSSALAQSLLRQSNAVQVFQLAIPIGFNKGDQLEARFTYCANGVDCDTEWVKLIEQTKLEAAIKKTPLSQECPAIEFTPDVHCEKQSSPSSSSSSSSSNQCFVSFVNLTPNRPLDWVDLHFSSNAPMALEAVGIATGNIRSSGSSDSSSSSIQEPEPIKLNFRMFHSAGMVGEMKMEMGMGMNMKMEKGMDMEKMDIGKMDSHEPMSIPMPIPLHHAMGPLGSSLLKRHSASQVFQFPLPAEFLEGSNVKASFTYCANGLDCDTKELKLEKPC